MPLENESLHIHQWAYASGYLVYLEYTSASKHQILLPNLHSACEGKHFWVVNPAAPKLQVSAVSSRALNFHAHLTL